MNLYENLATYATIETDRLLLRPFSMTDAADMFDYAGNPENLRYIFPAHRDIAETRHSIAMLFMKAPLGKWAIVLKSSGKMIGSIDFVKLNEKNRTGELGYVLNKSYWGEGLMTEAVRTLSEFALGEFGLYQLDIVADAENLGSIKVAEKSGYDLSESYKAFNQYTKILRTFKRYRKLAGHKK
ncbi:GNAT family N-acetyltransferase [Lactococcus insecticola]|uniref:N-acetyltransferase n=1 Tax=Pseudolactococcus insecticola TaxID=2709158 RepID=A0A6A0B7B3_9LACT|nr:GNAT family N-acetyltransferase [Lactococcus insecticola]GFH40204.1 N-acetyltransferase [Lactococcus insecticola]